MDNNKDNKDKRRNALGRGLSALLSDSGADEQSTATAVAPQPVTTSGVTEIGLDQIETNPYQPRTHFDLVALEELAHSIKVQGIIQPITVRRLSEGKYQLISGERRFQASKIAGLERVPAYIRTADDEQMLEMALIENIQRQDLNPVEIALAYQRLVDELNLRLEDLGDKVGKNRATVNNYMRLLKLPPEVQIGLRDGKISMGHARALITIENRDDQLRIFRDAVAQELSVRRIEELVRQLSEAQPAKPKVKTEKNIHVARLERTLEERFGSRVNITQAATGKGELKISFDSTEDLNRILEILG
jgi:ParB family chromosome partitioning protein